MKKHSIFLILILFSLFITGCKYDFIMPEEVPVIDNGGEPISFSTQIVPILTEKCNTCHSSQSPRMTADVAYSQLVPSYVNTSSPASSTIYVNASSGNHNNAKVSATQAALILAWITEGANNN
ncbi:MAG TPA: hypothetical protein VFC65_14470 [Prolixibacteraceae bacterium]|nr:hypothetical protein [Prolixibacteraceae bacterium]